MGNQRIRSTLPYVIGLIAAGLLFVLAGQIQYTARPGQLGPAFWPKLAIGLLAIVCLFEIARGLFGLRATRGVAAMLEDSESAERTRSFPALLTGGIALVGAYAVLVNVLGFLLDTLLFLAAFMYLGRYRNHVVIWSIAVGLTLVVALIFVRFAYVSLPRGTPPFDGFTDLVRTILGG